jgi:hypothetical protein
MEANELRIGNWIKYEDKLVQVVQLSSLMILCQRDENQFLVNCAPKEFQPIELTEEVLLKIGFKKDERMRSILYYLDYEINEDEYIRVRYVIYNLNTLPLLRITSPIPIILESCELTKLGIRYLHELQNAYYLLTNEELEVNL